MKSVVLFLPPFYFFVFDISNLLSYIQNNSSYELARPVMGTIFLVLQVSNSQKKSEGPFTPWIIAEANGKKFFPPTSNCMAGPGESCSHVASLLWAAESGVRIRDSMTVTQKKSLLGNAYWSKRSTLCTTKEHRFFRKEEKP